MINRPGGLVCVFGGETWPDEQFLYICDECGHAVCSDHSEWISVPEEWVDRFTHPVLKDGPGAYVRVCVGCVNPGLTYREWYAMEDGEKAKHMSQLEAKMQRYEAKNLGWRGSIPKAVVYVDSDLREVGKNDD